MTKTRVILVISFLLAFAAGLALGRLSGEQRLQADRPPPSRTADELNLTDEQREKLSAIWDAMRPLGQQHRDARNEARQQRETKIRDLLSEDQLHQFEQIQEEFRKANEGIDAERRTAFERAREQTKAILTEAQREKFDRMFRDRPRGGEDRGGPGGPRGPERGWDPDRRTPEPRERDGGAPGGNGPA